MGAFSYLSLSLCGKMMVLKILAMISPPINPAMMLKNVPTTAKEMMAPKIVPINKMNPCAFKGLSFT